MRERAIPIAECIDAACAEVGVAMGKPQAEEFEIAVEPGHQVEELRSDLDRLCFGGA